VWTPTYVPQRTCEHVSCHLGRRAVAELLV
jgi:hypothetical protein